MGVILLTVCMLLKRNFETFKKDSRVLREATALLEENINVIILLYSGEESIQKIIYKGIKVF